MNRSFFKEKPVLLDIFKSTGIYSSEETSECSILYYVYDGAIQILFSEQIVTVFKGQALLIGKDSLFQQFRRTRSGYYQLLMTPLQAFHSLREEGGSAKNGPYHIFEIEEDENFCQILCEKLLREKMQDRSSAELMDSLLGKPAFNFMEKICISGRTAVKFCPGREDLYRKELSRKSDAHRNCRPM